jgi:hypothetical protein
LGEGTPKIADLYEKYFPSDEDPVTLLDAVGIPKAVFEVPKFQFPALWKNLANIDEFVREHSLQALRETFALDYPSYILALAMGAGKSALIGAIIATEFAMALEYPEGPFVQKALVFAPGTTILGALRELAAVSYDRILPPRLLKQFAATVKLIFTRDGERDIPVIKGSAFNVVVNTTGTPYFKRQPLRDVVVWYGLSQGIADNILKTVGSNIHAYNFDGDAKQVVAQIVGEFFEKYRDVALPDGSPAKRAIYFPQTTCATSDPLSRQSWSSWVSPPALSWNGIATQAQRTRMPSSGLTIPARLIG